MGVTETCSAWHVLPGLDDERARQHREGAGWAVFMNVIELRSRDALQIGGRAMLTDISFTIASGEFIGVLGPNGAGKTTLMRAILGLLPPSAGDIRVFGRAPQRGNADIGYVPQVRTVLPDMRVRGLDFIASSVHGERWGVPSLSRADRKMIEETLAAVGAQRSRRTPAVRHVGRRTPAPAARPGAARRAAAAAARRAADQPRLSLSGGGDRAGARALPANAISRCCFPPTRSIS